MVRTQLVERKIKCQWHGGAPSGGSFPKYSLRFGKLAAESAILLPNWRAQDERGCKPCVAWKYSALCKAIASGVGLFAAAYPGQTTGFLPFIMVDLTIIKGN
jgi:hypothetical protein